MTSICLSRPLRLANHALTGGWELQPCTDQLFADQRKPSLARRCSPSTRFAVSTIANRDIL
jgi:hypothetical protein